MTAPDPVVIFDLTLPDRLRSLNEIKSGMQRHRDMSAWHRLLWAEVIRAGVRLPHLAPDERMRISITRLYGGSEREFDYDNLVGGCKGLVDSLTHLRLIRSDSPRWLERDYRQERSSTPGVRVRLEIAA